MFKEEVIGEINITSAENAWVYGSCILYENAKRFEELFKAIVSGDEGEDIFEESNFAEDMIDDDNWFINDNGEISGITIPAVYLDENLISFRQR